MYSEFITGTDSLWKDYRKKMKNGDYLIKDGIDSDRTEQYFKQAVKVLFVLKESNENGVPKDERKEKSIFDNNGWFTNYGSGDRAMITKMIKMYRYICAFKEGKKDTSVKEQPVDENDRYSFAFININKHGNGKKKCNNKKLKEHFNNDAGLLVGQINLLNPDIIVFGVKDQVEFFDKNIVANLKNKQVKTIFVPHFKRMGYAVFEAEARKVL